jgi:hypothetical protein
MKLNIGIFSKISAIGIVIAIFCSNLIESKENIIVLCVLISIIVSATYYSLCDSEGKLRKKW